MTIARKEHACTLCGKPIPQGTEYHREAVTPWTTAPDCDPGFATYYIHNECWTIWTVMRDHDEYERPPLDVWEQMVRDYQKRSGVTV